jgi:acylphosphatase
VIVTRHWIVSGRVQGVGFRAFTADCAARLNVAGFVRNRRDDTVEIVAQGLQSNIDQFFSLMQNGPSGARVDRISVLGWDGTETYSGFSIFPTL